MSSHIPTVRKRLQNPARSSPAVPNNPVSLHRHMRRACASPGNPPQFRSISIQSAYRCNFVPGAVNQIIRICLIQVQTRLHCATAVIHRGNITALQEGLAGSPRLITDPQLPCISGASAIRPPTVSWCLVPSEWKPKDRAQIRREGVSRQPCLRVRWIAEDFRRVLLQDA